ncbi:MAG: cation transporter [Chitinophagaceae bacterium]
MTHTYQITGMTCKNCEATVKSNLLLVPGVTGVEVSLEKQTATIEMEKHVTLSTFQQALGKKYTIAAIAHNEKAEQAKSWLVTFKPVLMIFGYILVIALAVPASDGEFSLMRSMNIFMAGFFITFSFFKMLDLGSFAESYAMYDIVARKIKGWGYIYAFAELGLGIAYATGFQPLLTNMITLLLMSVSIVGVLQSVLNKRKIRCACLGAVFNLPMTTITIIEDALMIGMSILMIGMLY